jgi:hypothetical protein
MNLANQLMDRIVLDLDKSILDLNLNLLTTKYLDSLSTTKVLMQRLIESNDAQIALAVERYLSKK